MIALTANEILEVLPASVAEESETVVVAAGFVAETDVVAAVAGAVVVTLAAVIAAAVVAAAALAAAIAVVAAAETAASSHQSFAQSCWNPAHMDSKRCHDHLAPSFGYPAGQPCSLQASPAAHPCS